MKGEEKGKRETKKKEREKERKMKEKKKVRLSHIKSPSSHKDEDMERPLRLPVEVNIVVVSLT